MPDLRIKREGWVECVCGKVRHVSIWEDTEELADLMMRLAEASNCRSCEVDHGRALNMCPEWVGTEDGAGHGMSACRLPWEHLGRCEPMTTPAAVVERLTELGFSMLQPDGEAAS